MKKLGPYVDDVISRYSTLGQSSPQIAARYGVDKATVLSMLRQHGVSIRPGRTPRIRPLSEQMLRTLYESGRTQKQIAAVCNVSPGTISNEMKRYGIPARHDKGDDASYWAFHKRLYKKRHRPDACEHCGSSNPDLWYEWANVSGQYQDVNDYVWLCRRCHRALDKAKRSKIAELRGRVA